MKKSHEEACAIDMTIMTVAKMLARRDKYTWQNHPNMRQDRKQQKLFNEARDIVQTVGSMRRESSGRCIFCEKLQ